MFGQGIGFLFSCLLWGILSGCALTAIYIAAVRLWYRHVNPGSYPICAILGLLLIIQCTMLSGAIKLHSSFTDLQNQIENLYSKLSENSEKSIEGIQDFIEQKLPGMRGFLPDTSKETSITDYATYIISGAKDSLRSYTMRRAAWILGFLTISTVCIWQFQRHTKSVRQSRRHTGISHERRRTSRRRR